MRRQASKRTIGTSILKSLVGGAIVLELAAFGVSYIAYARVNSSRESRLYLRDNFPVLLNFYYKIGETIDNTSQVRALDTQEWTRLGK